MSALVQCPACEGDGKVESACTCEFGWDYCGCGNGKVFVGPIGRGEELICPRCRGSNKITCQYCGGTARVVETCFTCKGKRWILPAAHDEYMQQLEASLTREAEQKAEWERQAPARAEAESVAQAKREAEMAQQRLDDAEFLQQREEWHRRYAEITSKSTRLRARIYGASAGAVVGFFFDVFIDPLGVVIFPIIGAVCGISLANYVVNSNIARMDHQWLYPEKVSGDEKPVPGLQWVGGLIGAAAGIVVLLLSISLVNQAEKGRNPLLEMLALPLACLNLPGIVGFPLLGFWYGWTHGFTVKRTRLK